jgi:hypothetical protein
VTKSAAVREPHRPLLFALALLIHAGLFQLLLSPRPARRESSERTTVLVFLPDARQAKSPPLEVAPLAPPPLPEQSPPADTAPQLIAPPEHAEARAPPAIDWRRDAEQVARDHALAAEAGRERKDDSGPPKPKPEFGWSHSRTHRIEPMESGGFVVWISDQCGVAISGLAMPFCRLGKKPARGDLFEHMNDPPAAGDWKDD